MKELKDIMEDFQKNSIDKTYLTKKFIESVDEEKLFSLLKEAKEENIEIELDLILKLLAHKNNAIKEIAKDIVLSKIRTNHRVKGIDCNIGDDKKENNQIFNQLFLYLKNKNPDVRNLALEILCNAVDYFLPEIGFLLKKENEDIKIYACQALGNSKKSKSISYIKEALKDCSVNVKNSAILALEETEVDYDISFLIDILKSEKEPWIKFSITEVIYKKGCSKFLKDLLPLIKAEPNFIKLNILKIFEQYCNKEYLIRLIKNSEFFKDESFSNFNKTIINILNSKKINYTKNTAIINYLIEIAQKDNSPWNIYQAIKLLSSLKDYTDKRLFYLFQNNLEHSHPLVKTAAIEAMASYTGLKMSLVLEEFFNKKELT